VAQLKADQASKEEALRLNAALRSQLNFAQQNNYQLTGADIISQDPTNYKQYLTINKGSNSGIQKGQVVVSGGLVVGRITETTPGTAKVYLITDFNSAVPALDQATRATGLVRGDRGFGLKLEMVPQTDQLKEGDVLITSGFGGDYPKGLVIGTVGEVKQRAADVFQSAAVNPAVDFRKLEEVFVITGQK
jgi:rod shape-determining protein MreC